MNRFFKTDDERVNVIDGFKIPRVWWSRPYEYCFALEFAKDTDTVLDVGCGLEHPFKHALGKRCKKVVAIDTDKLIEGVKDDNVEFVCADILDYKPKVKFDKIFIISTLEQTQDYMIEKFKNIESMLAEGGKVVITSDYPSLDPNKLIKFAKEANLVPTSKFNEEIPSNALYHTAYKLNCYGIVLEREQKAKPKKVEEKKTKVDKPKRTKPAKTTRTKKG